MRLIALVLSVLVVAPACGRKKAPPPPSTTSTIQQPAPTKISAPASVPQELKDLVQKEWDSIVKEGDLFLEKFKEAQAAKEQDDRAAMDIAIQDANEHYQRAADMWAEIAYWPDNAEGDGKIDGATADACRNWLGTYNKRVDEWTKKNKGLKEFSRNK